MKNQTTRRPLNLPYPVILTLIALGGLLIYIIRNQDIFAAMLEISALDFLIMLMLYLVFILLLGYLSQLIIHQLNPRIKSWEIIGLQFVNNFLNKILPKGGVAFRAVYLKQRYHLSYAFFLANFVGLVLVSLASQSLVSLLAMLYIYTQTGFFSPILALGFGGLLLGTIAIMMFKPKVTADGNWLLRQIKLLAEGWGMVVQNPGNVLKYIFVSILILAVDSLTMFFVFRALEIQIQYPEAVILSSLSILFSYINITPDGLGIREVVYLYTASILTLSNPQIVLGSLTQRAVALVASMLFGGASYFALLRTKTNRASID